MWRYEKRLQYPVNIKEPNAKIAKIILKDSTTIEWGCLF